MCSKQTPEESNIDEDEIVEELQAIIQEEVVDYNEPTVDYGYYEPTLDSDSEFPWHHPDNQVADIEINVPKINMSEFHNPWDIYGGNIPARKESFAQNDQTVDDYQEIRKQAWDYTYPHQTQYQTESHNYEQTFHNNEHNDNHTSKHMENVWQPNYESSPNFNQVNTHVDNHSDHHQQHQVNTHVHIPHSDDHHQHQQHYTNLQHHTQDHYNVTQYHYENTSSVHQGHFDKDIQEHNYSEPHHNHEYQHNNFNVPKDKNHIFNQSPNNESQVDNHVCHTHNLMDHEHLGKKVNNFTSSSQIRKQNGPQIYSVMMDHVRLNHHVSEGKLNGYASDDDTDIYEDITPRHPYDGFYLRHRMTIDSRGRKICSHEIPLRPPSPMSESSDEFEDAIETPEEITDKGLNAEDSHTGVAGNLARVVPGAPLQQEAVDELARRQGWEAGNIDYMGADSFDNIWAKISQTLSQPPNSEQPEAPKEEAQPEAVADPPSAAASVEVVVQPAPEPVAPVSESAAVNTPSETAEVATQVVDAPEEEKVEVAPSEAAPTEVPTPAASETIEVVPETAAEAPAEVAAVVEPTPVEVPVPVEEAPAPTSEISEAPGKPEEIIPVPVEVAAVELAASAPADVIGKTEPEAAEIPVAALEALKIDETAVVETTKEQAVPASASSVPEPTPAPSEDPKPAEATDKLEASSDSPPLANTPSKEEIPVAPAAKSEERRKPVGKLQLRPPLAADAALTPDSEAEDAAALAQSIIAGELRTPTVTGPTPPALSPSAAPPADSRLSVQPPAAPTPPVGAVSLSQIGIKPKPSTAARIESSVKTDSAPSTPESPKAADPPKKKIVKKVVKKDKDGASSGEAPVPPPRKKEKKPKEK